MIASYVISAFLGSGTVLAVACNHRLIPRYSSARLPLLAILSGALFLIPIYVDSRVRPHPVPPHHLVHRETDFLLLPFLSFCVIAVVISAALTWLVRGKRWKRPEAGRRRSPSLHEVSKHSWVFTWSRLLGGSILLSAAISGSLLFSVGLVLANGWQFADTYLHTPQMYLGMAGISLVTFAGAWADHHLVRMGEAVPQAFVARRHVSQLFERERRAIVGGRVPLLVTLALALASAYYIWGHHSSTNHNLLPRSWHTESTIAPKVILTLYCVPSLLMLTTMVHGAIRFFVLVHRVLRNELAHPLAITREHLRPIAEWSMFTGCLWSIGALIAFIFIHPAMTDSTGIDSTQRIHWWHNHYSVVAVCLAILSTVWALALFFIPQTLGYLRMREERAKLLSAIMDVSVLHPGPDAFVHAQFGDSLQRERLSLAIGVLDAPEWIRIKPSELLLFTFQALLPWVPIVVGLSKP